MRAKAGDPPRTMAQKILAGRCADPLLRGDSVSVRVDQVVLTRTSRPVVALAREAGLKKTPLELAVAYVDRCVAGVEPDDERESELSELLPHGIAVGRAGIGHPAPVHLERFASPARLALTDDPRLAGVGGMGMLTLVVAPGALAQALAFGTFTLRPPASVQILLSGRTRPFVCARDVAFELLRRGLREVVATVERTHDAPVVLEFGGPSSRLLSVGERSVLAALAPQVGAAGSLFLSDERTEVFLRDQRRSKAHRALQPDAGAPSAAVVSVDLGAVDPLLLDESGVVRTVRDLAGKPVGQVLLGGDSGVTLRDLFAAAALLKSKRVPPRTDVLLALPSRQMLEVLAASGALADLLATGARIVEPDGRLMRGRLYPPPSGTLSVRTCDSEPVVAGRPGFVVASAETCAHAVATGEIGDPRAFKRPVRVTIPRVLPTDDVLVLRERKGGALSKEKGGAPRDALEPWKGLVSLAWVAAADFLGARRETAPPRAVACATLDEVRAVVDSVLSDAAGVRAVVAAEIPAASVAALSAVGVLALSPEGALKKAPAKGDLLKLAAPTAKDGPVIAATIGAAKVSLSWRARGVERDWALAGGLRPQSPRK